MLPSPLIIADKLVRKAADDGIAATVAIARKGKGLDSAMGWAWLVVQDRTESDSGDSTPQVEIRGVIGFLPYKHCGMPEKICCSKTT